MTENKAVKISVIVPAYNVENYIGETLDSIINQTFKDFELICIDDGSTDSTAKIIDNYSDLDDRIRVIHQDNRGLAASRNVGINISRGEYILFVDSDDEIREDSLELLYNRASEKDLDVLYFNGVDRIKNKSQHEENRIVEHIIFPQIKQDYMTGEEMIDWLIKNGRYRHRTYHYLLKKEYVSEVNLSFIEGIIHEDCYFTYNAIVNAGKISVLDEELYYRNIRDKSITTSKITYKNCFGLITSAIKMAGIALKKYESISNVPISHINVLSIVLYEAEYDYKVLSDEEKSKLSEELEDNKVILQLFDEDNCWDFDALSTKENDSLALCCKVMSFINLKNELMSISDNTDSVPNMNERKYLGIRTAILDNSEISQFIENYKLEKWIRIIAKNTFAELTEKFDRDIVVSLTSFPKRIGIVSQVINNILNQKKKVSRIVLWLSNEEFPEGIASLPDDLVNIYEAEDIFSIEFCNNLLPHKKYFDSFKKYPDSLIITVDDDVVYSEDMVEGLFLSYLEFPEAVSANRVHLMVFDENKKLLPYNDWIFETDIISERPSMQLMSTGVGGVLYDPLLLDKEFLDEKAIRKTCLKADDLWLKAMEVMSDVPVVYSGVNSGIKTIPNSQETALYHSNMEAGYNDEQLSNITEYLDSKYDKDCFYKRIINSEYDDKLLGIKEICKYYRNYIQDYRTTKRNEIRSLQESKDRIIKEKKELQEKLQRTYAEKSEINAELQKTYDEKSEINAKLQKTYAEKSELGELLKQTYAEKSEINAKLQKTYAEKSERGIRIKELEKVVKENKSEIKLLNKANKKQTTQINELIDNCKQLEKKYNKLENSKDYKIGNTILKIPRKCKKVLKGNK